MELLCSAAHEVAPRIVETRALVQSSSFLAHAKVGMNRDPRGKLTEFANILDDGLGAEIDVAVMKFCYADVTASTDGTALFDAYCTAIDDLRERHPGVKFVHATVPLTTDRCWKAKTKALLGRDDRRGPADNLARERYNSMVRARYADTDGVFDIAAVEATMQQQPTVRHLSGQRYLVLNRALSSDAGHLNSLGSQVAAAEFVRALASTLQ
ncbi:hypothetical protein [Microlunatus aurantiacus]|uniref:hypothetical protein n=1 Tax=Microlunatus aurantiacus TaxID=446786 RepID=UPI0031D10F8C